MVRPALPGDADAMCAVINPIIALGGTTAHEAPFTPEALVGHYIRAASVICCHVALAASDAVGSVTSHAQIVGFQVLGRNPGLPDDWAEIGSFVSLAARGSGAAPALFAATVAVARGAGIAAIDATIRADNRPGLAYYTRMGFVDYAADPGYCLKDGMRVGRISKRFDTGGGAPG